MAGIKAYKKRIVMFTLVAGLVAGPSLFAMPVAQAIEQGGIGGRPARPIEGNSRSESIFVHTMKPGTTAKDAVQVVNNTDQPKLVKVYPADSQASSGGAFACAQAADAPTAVGKWVQFSADTVTVPPLSKQEVEFTITVPEDAAPGEHNGCIVIQNADKTDTVSGGNGIVLSLRSAIRLAITVPGKIQKGLTITEFGLKEKDADKVTINTTLRNNGNVSVDARVAATLSYPRDIEAAKQGGSFPVLSGSEGQFNFETDRPYWGGWLLLKVVAEYNDNPEVGIGQAGPTASISAEKWVFISPAPAALLVEATAAAVPVLAGAVLIQRTVSRRRYMKRAIEHPVQKKDDIGSVAALYGMPWKKLARINKLKAPYTLAEGKTLKVVPAKKLARKKAADASPERK